MTGPRSEPFRTRLARWLRIAVTFVALLVVTPIWMGWAVQVEFGWPLWSGLAAGVFTAAAFVPAAIALRRAGWHW